jgi:dimethylaniline monooxygenase (N-oxide forming)
VARDEDAKKWIVRTKDGPDQSFDRVVVPTGANALPNVPDIPGLDHFKGEAIHSRSFKRPSNFKDKSVLVVGFANTAADTASELVGHAKQIYLSHQHGCIVVCFPQLVHHP